tara:strand:- start:182 stop:922 length:741 start_codon:yes stop_codon:yes gene_type:complete
MNLQGVFTQTELEKCGINRAADIVVAVMLACMFGGSLYSAETAAWAGTYYIQIVIIPLLLAFIVVDRKRSTLLGHLFVLGLITGIVELFADYLLVDVFKILIYTSPDPRVWSSPLNMPISWASVIVTQGYLVIRIIDILGLKFSRHTAVITGSLVGGVISGLTIGAYEALAYNASWWKYIDSPFMVFTYAPLAIILGEVAIFAVFIYWFRLSSLNKRWSLPLAGIGLGLTIAAAYSLFHLLLKVMA